MTDEQIRQAFDAFQHPSDDMYSDFESFAAGYKAALASLEQVAWERKWHRDGEVPKKEKNANGRSAWPLKFKLHPITEIKCLHDDIPLYRIKEKS